MDLFESISNLNIKYLSIGFALLYSIRAVCAHSLCSLPMFTACVHRSFQHSVIVSHFAGGAKQSNIIEELIRL